MEEKKILLESYKQLASFLSESMGPQFNTVVYQVDSENGTGNVYAAYGKTADREVGEPLTPFGEVIIRSLRTTNAPGITHVDTEASTGYGRVRLSMFPIKDSSNRIVGLFAIEVGIELHYQVQEALIQYLGYDSAEQGARPKAPGVINEGAGVPFSEYMQQRIREEIASFGVPVEMMTNEERSQIIHRLEQLEVFYMKDSVKTTAELLGISVPTVYRLMKR